MAASLEALIAAIDQDPDDDARYLVLADALITAGDPRSKREGPFARSSTLVSLPT